MATLYVRDIPDSLYDQLKKRAAGEGRSISQEVVRVLRLGLLAARTGPNRELAAWLQETRRQRLRWTKAGRTFPDSVALIREDRHR